MKRLVPVLLLLSLCRLTYSHQISSGDLVDSGVNQTTYIYQHLDKFGCPEYFERLEMLRGYQRRGYAYLLSRCCSQDILSAIIDYIRIQLQIEYSMNHQPVRCTYADGTALYLSLDWAYPVDPWKRDSITHH